MVAVDVAGQLHPCGYGSENLNGCSGHCQGYVRVEVAALESVREVWIGMSALLPYDEPYILETVKAVQ